MTIAFTNVHAFVLPPEARYLVAKDVSKSEMKVMLCVLLNYYQNGIDAHPISANEICEQTGLTRSTVYDGLNAALDRGAIQRCGEDGLAQFEPSVRETGHMTCHDIYITKFSNIADFSNDDEHVSEISERYEISERLKQFGLATHVADNIALTDKYPLERLRRQLDYVQFEIDNGLTKSVRNLPGYVVNRIKRNCVAPSSYHQKDDEWDAILVT